MYSASNRRRTGFSGTAGSGRCCPLPPACGPLPPAPAAAGQALDNAGNLWKESAERRLRAQELAVEKLRLDLEVARLAQQDRHLERILPAEPVDARVPAHPATSEIAGSGGVVVVNQPPARLWSPGLAAVLSFFLTGLGQLYNGQIINGVAWFLMVMFGYAALVIPGLILHFFCVLGALSGNPWTEGKTIVVEKSG